MAGKRRQRPSAAADVQGRTEAGRAGAGVLGPGRTGTARGRRFADGVLLLALVAVTLGVYHPAWSGSLLWDDAAHITAPALRGLDGLWRIWFEPGVTQQYYPLVHSAFWLEHRLWGDATLGYHLVNIILHACSAFLVGLILRRLAVPGAWLAAAIFALHPVQVESVAWITELKNTLSGVLGLGATFAYLGFDRTRQKRRYAAALSLFVLARASKTVSAMLAPMLLAALWWQRGRLSWRRDVAPLVPFLVVGASAGLVTAVVERTAIGAQGALYDFTPIERCLIAGRAVWFYLGSLAWPSRLVFIYPRWHVSQAIWWQYLYPLAALALLAGAWAVRGTSRAPFAALIALLAGLFPALGFLNVYPFRYSFVADHFQYLACIPVMALFAGALTKITWDPRWARLTGAPTAAAPPFAHGVRGEDADAPRSGVAIRRARTRYAATAAAALLLVALGVLSFRESREYVSAKVLYETTLRDNPACVLAEINLGIAIAETPGTDPQTAVDHFKRALAIQPDSQEAHFNLGLAYHRMGRLADAVASYRRSLQVGPEDGGTLAHLCNALNAMGNLPEARTACERAVALAPGSAAAQFGLGATLRRTGELTRALDVLAQAARLAPDQAETYVEMGIVLQELGRLEESASAYRTALRFGPRSPAVLAGLGFVLAQQGQVPEAMRLYQEAITLDPGYTDARYYLGTVLQSQGRLREAVEQYRAVLALNSSDGAVHNNLGLALEDLGQPIEALAHYREAVRLRPDLAQARDNLRRVARGR